MRFDNMILLILKTLLIEKYLYQKMLGNIFRKGTLNFRHGQLLV